MGLLTKGLLAGIASWHCHFKALTDWVVSGMGLVAGADLPSARQGGHCTKETPSPCSPFKSSGAYLNGIALTAS